VIPRRSHRSTKPRAFDAVLYRQRYRVEFLFNRLKQFRRVATRYEKTARNCRAMVQIGCIRIWARSEGAPMGCRAASTPDASVTVTCAPGPPTGASLRPAPGR
jgi:hypothetical protein